MLEITPTNFEIYTEDNNKLPGRAVAPEHQIAVIYINLKNVSDSSLTIDRDFYYESFGIIVEGNRGVAQMDTDFFPFDGVFFGDLEAGETVETRLEIFQAEGQMYLVFGLDGDLERKYEVSWKIG